MVTVSFGTIPSDLLIELSNAIVDDRGEGFEACIIRHLARLPHEVQRHFLEEFIESHFAWGADWRSIARSAALSAITSGRCFRSAHELIGFLHEVQAAFSRAVRQQNVNSPAEQRDPL